MNKNVAGVTVPDDMIERMKKAEDKVATSVEITVELVKGLQPHCQGLHFMPLGWNQHVVTVPRRVRPVDSRQPRSR